MLRGIASHATVLSQDFDACALFSQEFETSAERVRRRHEMPSVLRQRRSPAKKTETASPRSDHRSEVHEAPRDVNPIFQGFIEKATKNAYEGKTIQAQFAWGFMAVSIASCEAYLSSGKREDMVVKIKEALSNSQWLKTFLAKLPKKLVVTLGQMAGNLLLWQTLAIFGGLMLLVVVGLSVKAIFSLNRDLGRLSSSAQQRFKLRIGNKLLLLERLLGALATDDQKAKPGRIQTIQSLCCELARIIEAEQAALQKVRAEALQRAQAGQETAASIRNWALIGGGLCFVLAPLCPPTAMLGGVTISKALAITTVGLAVVGIGQELCVDYISNSYLMRIEQLETDMLAVQELVSDIQKCLVSSDSITRDYIEVEAAQLKALIDKLGLRA